MKIAFYYDLPSGGAKRTMEEIEALLSHEHQLAFFHNQNLNFKTPFLKRFFTDLDSTLIQSFIQKIQAKYIDSQKFDLVFVTHDKHFQAPWILRYLKTPTLFLCQEPTRAFFEEFLAVDRSLPLINRIYETFLRAIKKTIEIKNAGHATRIMVNSHYSVESVFRSYGVLAKPIRLGIDPHVYYPQNKHRKRQILIVGNHEPQKALIFALEVISKIPTTIRPKLIVASPRPRHNSELLRLSKKLKVNIEIATELSREKMRSLYNTSMLTLATAHLEPFGLSVVESLACGTPVVAVNEGGFKETVTHGKSGLLLERDSDLFAKEISNLITSKDIIERMGKFGIKDVNERFTWQICVAKINSLINEIIKK